MTLLLIPARSAYAQGPNPGGGQVLFGRNYTLESGDTFEGDLVVFGGNVTIEEDASLNGNLVVIGGTITSNGETKGDVVVVGGQVSLEESALVTGDVVTVGGQLTAGGGRKNRGGSRKQCCPGYRASPWTDSADGTKCSGSARYSKPEYQHSASTHLPRSFGSSSGQ